MTLRINNVNAVDFFVKGTPVERGYLNGQLFWERKLDIWVSQFLTGGQTQWFGYFDIHAHVQQVSPGFKGDVTCHVDCPVISTSVEYPLDVGAGAKAWGYKSFVIRIEPSGRVYGYGGVGGKGGIGTYVQNGGRDKPSYMFPDNGYCHNDQFNRGGRGGGLGSMGGGCINCRTIAQIQVPNGWRSYIMAGGGGGGGGAKLNSSHVPAGGGGGIGYNNAPGGDAAVPGGAGSGSACGLGGRGTEGPNNYGGPGPQPPIGGYGGLGVNWGENGWAPGNGGNGGSWNQGGGGGAMSLQLWSNWSWEGHYKGRDAALVPDPTSRAAGAAPGSYGSGHDYRRPWVDGGWGGQSGQPVLDPKSISYY